MSFFKQRPNSNDIDGNESVKNHFKMANLAGTKWGHVGSGRTGINSILDKEIIDAHLKTKERNMARGYLKLQLQGSYKVGAVTRYSGKSYSFCTLLTI